jgi:nucleotide-binding universal stress UspA family protein
MTRPGSDIGPTARAGGPCMILGYDRSEGSRHAACWAAGELAAGGKLVIVYACRGQHMPPNPLSSTGERHDEGRAILDELMLDGDDALFDVDLEMKVSDQDPAAALIDAAKHHDARAIVLGAKPHSRLHEALGTVTTELLRTSPVPVITVPLSAVLPAGVPLTQSAAVG